MATTIRELSYRTAFDEFEPRILQLLQENGFHDLCEIGGGRNPGLPLEDLEGLDVRYTIADVSQDELDLAPEDYRRLCMDIAAPLPPDSGEQFDLIFSKFVAEHVRSGHAMHRNVLHLLRPGGMAFHIFPTLYHPAFVVNRLLPMSLTDRIRNAAAGVAYPKFPPVYSMCFGPSPKRITAFRAMGYEVVEYRGFYGTPYLQRVPVLRRLDRALDDWLARRRARHFTSYVLLLLRKPAVEGP